MVNMKPIPNISIQRGTSMIEVLVTIVILTFGLLGLVGMQTRLQMSEVESYQRAQGLILIEDMASRIATNRNSASSYVTGTSSPLGTGNSCTYSAGSSRQAQDSCEWSNALQGAGEVTGGSKVGAMIGARGCVEDMGGGAYMVTVAWQGTVPISAPPSSVACGAGSYNTGSFCTSDRCRRVLTTVVRITDLF
jgi:type IV pilus assembly protein PilV